MKSCPLMSIKIPKIIIFSVITFTLYVILFGFSQFGMGANGQAVKCPFSGHSMSICNLNITEHIQEWQAMFTTLPSKDAIAILFALFLFVALQKLTPWKTFSFPEIKNVHTYFLLKDRFHIFDPLKDAFSRGILNPKLF